MKSNLAESASAGDRSDLYFSYAVKNRVNNELISMSTALKLPLHDEPFSSICVNAALRLYEIERLYTSGDINPFVQIRTGDYDPTLKVTEQMVRVGFYPVAADPFHWGHLIAGLNAIVQFKLDKVVFLIAGSDLRKPGLTPAAIRHPMGQDVLRCFKPLFEYSPIAYDRDCDGERGLFHFLKLNPHQKMDVYYLAGSDHYRRYYPDTVYPDTIQKLEDHIENRLYGYTDAMHGVSVGFIQREEVDCIVDTFLEVQFLPEIPFAVSSSMIREAFKKQRDRRTLALLPYTAYVDILTFNLYGASDFGRRAAARKVAPPPAGIGIQESFAYVY